MNQEERNFEILTNKATDNDTHHLALQVLYENNLAIQYSAIDFVVEIKNPEVKININYPFFIENLEELSMEVGSFLTY